jgi:hypothetical protein
MALILMESDGTGGAVEMAEAPSQLEQMRSSAEGFSI